MSLQSLVLCSDEKIVRVLRRVLVDLEIGVEHCTEADSAIHRLTRQRFEAVIVDCAEGQRASQVLRSARSAPCNQRAVAVAIIDANTALRSAFELGAHFVLYKPLSSERAKASFRAARALMKRERRRNTRVQVQIPVTLRMDAGAGLQRGVTSDLGEGGIAVQLPQRTQNLGPMSVHFALPGTQHTVECLGEVAWENGRQLGIRFVDLHPETYDQLKAWLETHSPEMEKDDPPARCKLSDVSRGGCYLESSSPFPVRTRVILSTRVAGLELRLEGVVRVMHPEVGMGVEFTQKTAHQREHVKEFVRVLTSCRGTLPDLLVAPEGLDRGEPVVSGSSDEPQDALLDLFRKKAEITTEDFLIELRRQRGSNPESAEPAIPV